MSPVSTFTEMPAAAIAWIVAPALAFGGSRKTAKPEKTRSLSSAIAAVSWLTSTARLAIAKVRNPSAPSAFVGKGPDVVYGWYDDAHQYPDKLVDLTDLGEYLDKKYGGWYDVCRKFGMREGKWIAIPLGAAGARIVYRMSALKEAGFDTWPTGLDGMLKVSQALAAKGKPGGLALGNAVGDGNTWCHWLVWSHGGKMVDENDKVVINSPETIAALNYAKELYKSFVPGTLSWLDPSNNKAFLDGQISWTINGISVYYAAKNSDDEKIKALAEDINHAVLPIGPVGRPTELHLTVPAMVFAYTKFPNAAKDYIRFMLEREQYVPWQEASLGYFSQPLREYEKSPIWTADPKHTPYRDLMVNMQWPGYAGSLGYASAGVMADFVMVNMVAQAASGDRLPKKQQQRRRNGPSVTIKSSGPGDPGRFSSLPGRSDVTTGAAYE